MGVSHSSLLHARRYDQSKAQILTIANIALARLRAEGDAHRERHDAPELLQPSSGAKHEDSEDESDSSAPNAVKKKRGRPQLIPDERKIAAAELKAAGGTNREAAVLIYGKKYPSPQETKNVSTILKHYLKKSGPPGSSANSSRSAAKPRKNKG